MLVTPPDAARIIKRIVATQRGNEVMSDIVSISVVP